MEIKVRVPAKINLRLHVGPVREDGYHSLSTVYCAVSLYDELIAEPADDITVHITGEGADQLPSDDRNLVFRAAQLLAQKAGVSAGVKFTAHKGIPVAAGLAGGSADAAAALTACNALWNLGLDRSELLTLAAELGSDVPFPLVGGVAIGQGRGEIIHPLSAPNATKHWVLAVADFGLSTPAVFAELDRLRANGEVPASDMPDLTGLTADQLLNDPLYNDLQPAAFSLAPQLRETVAAAGIVAESLIRNYIISGSGPTIIFPVPDLTTGKELATHLALVGSCRWARVVSGPVRGALEEARPCGIPL